MAGAGAFGLGAPACKDPSEIGLLQGCAQDGEVGARLGSRAGRKDLLAMPRGRRPE